jgi:hypothetical protein
MQGNHDKMSTNTPIFYLDASYPELHIAVRTGSARVTTDKNQAPSRNSLSYIKNTDDCDMLKLHINYIPIQRWVNVILIIDNEYVQLLMDGELRKVIDTTDSEKMSINDSYQTVHIDDTCGTKNLTEVCCSKRQIGLSTDPRLTVGHIGTDAVMDGYLSKVQLFNYALTIEKAKMIYQSGPLHRTVLSRIGIPAYGIRNPFYKVGALDDAKEDLDDKEKENT